MTLLYRFLFFLYAEGKSLLDLNEQHYNHSYSFHHTKHGIAEVQDGPVDYRYDTKRTALLSIMDLFNFVKKGNVVLGISKRRDVLVSRRYGNGYYGVVGDVILK